MQTSGHAGPSQGASTWVGALELSEDGSAVGMSGPVREGQEQARVLVRLHDAPIGYVCVPTAPLDTLAGRIREAARTELAEGISRHLAWDEIAGSGAAEVDWAARVACPGRFPDSRDTGLTIVVCTRDRTKGLRECLGTLGELSYAPLEILVVDNAPSTGATRELVTGLAQDDPRIRYTCEPRPGLSVARNHGLVNARFGIVAFTDDDTLVDPGWPRALVAGFAADPDAVCITGLVASSALDSGPEQYFDARIPWGEHLHPRRYDLVEHRDPSGLYPYRAGIFGGGANFAVRKDVALSLGGFDPLLGAGGLGRGGEDLDMFLRLVLSGGRICYLPSALIWHRNRSSESALSDQMYSYGHGLGAYVAKHLPNRDFRAALARHGFKQARVLGGRMRTASQASQMGSAGSSLALNEARGAVVGALRYARAARKVSPPALNGNDAGGHGALAGRMADDATQWSTAVIPGPAPGDEAARAR